MPLPYDCLLHPRPALTNCITSPTQTHNILQHSKAENTIFNNGRYTTNIPTDPHTVTTTDIKTNMRHIHTSIVSRHLATRGNNKILRTPPPHISSSEEKLPRLTRRTLAQLRINKCPFLKSYCHKVDAKTHPTPLCPLCNIHTHDTHHLFNCTRIHTTLSPLDLWTDPAGVTVLLARWTEKLASGPQAGTSDSPPPLARVMGVGRQQPALDEHISTDQSTRPPQLCYSCCRQHTPPPIMVDGSNIRLYANRPMVSPTSS